MIAYVLIIRHWWSISIDYIGIDYIISIDDIATDIIGIDLLYNIGNDCSYSIPITYVIRNDIGIL